MVPQIWVVIASFHFLFFVLWYPVMKFPTIQNYEVSVKDFSILELSVEKIKAFYHVQFLFK
jgi:hypothetical protein